MTTPPLPEAPKIPPTPTLAPAVPSSPPTSVTDSTLTSAQPPIELHTIQLDQKQRWPQDDFKATPIQPPPRKRRFKLTIPILGTSATTTTGTKPGGIEARKDVDLENGLVLAGSTAGAGNMVSNLEKTSNNSGAALKGEGTLPLPVTTRVVQPSILHNTLTGALPSGLSDPFPSAKTKQKTARISKEGLRVRWAKFKQQLGTGSSMLSDSAFDPGEGTSSGGGGGTLEGTGGSEYGFGCGPGSEFGGTVGGGGFSSTPGGGARKSQDGRADTGAGRGRRDSKRPRRSGMDANFYDPDREDFGCTDALGDEGDDDEVDQVVVDNEMGDEFSSHPSEAADALLDRHGANGHGHTHLPNPPQHSGSGGGHSGSGKAGTGECNSTSASASGRHSDLGSRWQRMPIIGFFLKYIWPAVSSFFSPRFYDEQIETNFRRESWFTGKSLAIYAGLFFVLNWILVCSLSITPFAISDNIYFYGVGPLISIPIPLIIIFEYPRLKPRLYQLYLFICVWSWPIYQSSFMFACGFYSKTNHCGSRDFIGLFYYCIGLQTIAMFGLQQARFCNLVGIMIFFVINCVLLVPLHRLFARNLINLLVFHLFLMYIHYKREMAERRLYSLRNQLKQQFRATQKAQVNERKASDSKRRLTSYVFHEVRVPLNTALLAIQNLQAAGTVSKEYSMEWAALGGSLIMMSKVLNDVLDFNRLDSGRFSTVRQPFVLHQAIRSMLVPLQLAADARNLELRIELDKGIDEIARKASYKAKKRDDKWIEQEMATNPDQYGIVVGDEMRLRQVVTNLASNACKFTPIGGQIRVVTKLARVVCTTKQNVHVQQFRNLRTDSPVPGEDNDRRQEKEQEQEKDRPGSSSSDGGESGATKALSASHLSEHNSFFRDATDSANTPDKVVVRVEIHDTGVGIRPRDLIDNKLFSPYVQTEIGKYQGGKGTGLGLALVRRIVKLGGGRLGVKSKANVGSIFWVELPFGIGEKTLKSDGFKADFTTADSDHSGGFSMEKALDAEGGKFYRANGEGETPSTDEQANAGKASVHNAAQPEPLVKTMMESKGGFEFVYPRRNTVANGSRPQTATQTSDDPSNANVPVPPATQEKTVQREEMKISLPPPEMIMFPITQSDEGDVTPQPSIPSPILNPLAAPAPAPPPAPLPTSVPEPPPDKPPQSSSEDDGHGDDMPLLPSGPPLRILVVDDDMLTRKLMARMLTRLGCAVETAENGKRALEKIVGHRIGSATGGSERYRKGAGRVRVEGAGEAAETAGPPSPELSFDIVFLDNQMPVMSGLDAVSALRRRGRKELVVGVTGNALLSDQEEYLIAGVDKVLTKPVLERSLKAVLRMAADRRKERELQQPPPQDTGPS